MDELKNRLTRELGRNLQVKIKAVETWNLPIHPVKVNFETVRQTKMDVLMKMLLIAFREADFAEVSELSDILLVEPIFIENLTRKMTYAGLIEKNPSFFTLTTKGLDQLAAETFIDQVEEASETLIYSPCHGKLLAGALEEEPNDEFADYRFYDDFTNWELKEIDRSMIHKGLQPFIAESEKPNVQTIVSEILSIAPLPIEVIPCIEFRLYNQTEDIFYARVWNTMLNIWDETLEAQINERDRKNWRKMYINH